MGGMGGVGSSQATLPYFQTTIPFFLIPLGRSFAPFRTCGNHNSFLFMELRTLRQETGGVGGTPTGCLGIRRDSCAQHAVVPSRYRKTRYMHLKLPAGRCCLFFRSFLITDS